MCNTGDLSRARSSSSRCYSSSPPSLRRQSSTLSTPATRGLKKLPAHPGPWALGPKMPLSYKENTKNIKGVIGKNINIYNPQKHHF